MRKCYIVVKVKDNEWIYTHDYYDSLEEAMNEVNRLNKKYMDLEKGTFYALLKEIS